MICSQTHGGHAASDTKRETAVGDERSDDTLPATGDATGETAAGDESGPIVPPELVPAIEQPAKPRPAPLWKSLSVAVAAVLVLAGIGAGLLRANAVWGTRAMTSTAVVAVEALVQGDADGLAAISTPEMQKQLTAKVRAEMNRVGSLVDFSEPTWDGDRAQVKAMIGPAEGGLVLAPDAQVGDAAAFTTNGSLGNAVGIVDLTRDWSGWRVSGIRVQPAK